MQRFFAVLDASDLDKYGGGDGSATSAATSADIPFSQNIAVGKTPFTNVSAHYHNIRAGVLLGTCLWVDFPFPAFPENMGHWAEVLAPIYSALTNASWRQRAPDSEGYLRAVIFPNLRREQVQVGAWLAATRAMTSRGGLQLDQGWTRVFAGWEDGSLLASPPLLLPAAMPPRLPHPAPPCSLPWRHPGPELGDGHAAPDAAAGAQGGAGPAAPAVL